MYFDNIQDLKEAFLVTPPPNGEYIVAGFYLPGDGGEGTFVWVALSVSPLLSDDGGIIIEPVQLIPGTTTPNPVYGTGYFKRIYSGPINVRWFGAKGDGSTDDTAAVHAARDSNFTKDGIIYFPESRDSAGNITPYFGALNMLDGNI